MKRIKFSFLYRLVLGCLLMVATSSSQAQTSGITSQFSIALADSAQLQLTPAQIKKLQQSQKRLADSIGLVQAYPDSIQFDRSAFESRVMDALLSNKQYNRVLNKKNKSWADAEAKKIWDSAVARHEEDLYVKDSVLPKLTAHLLASRNIHDRYAHNRATYDSAAKTNYLPDAVHGLEVGNAFWGSLSNSQMTQVLQNRKTIGLNQQQTQQLLATNRQLTNKMKQAKKDGVYFNWPDFENNQLWSVLTPAQINQLMLIRHQDNAAKTANDQWATALANHATGNYTQPTALQQLNNYYLQYHTLQDTYSGNKKAKDSALAVLYAQTPDSLHILLSGNRFWDTDTIGLVSFAARNQQALALRDGLVDTLLLQARWAKRQEKEAMHHRDSLVFSRSAFDASYLPTVLTDSQYAKLLILRFWPDAQAAAQKDWQQLTTLGLAANYNQDTTTKALAAYHLRYSCVEARYAANHPLRRKMLWQIDLTMPAAMAALKHTKQKSTTKPASGMYVW